MQLQLDDPSLSPTGIFSKLQLEFNREDVVVEIPPDAVDIADVDNIDPNDMSRITIQRDCKIVMNCHIFIVLIRCFHNFFIYNYIHNYVGRFITSSFDTTMTEYKAVLKQWNKGTSGDPGLDIHFDTWDEDKFTKYNLYLENCNHALITDCPPILIDY